MLDRTKPTRPKFTFGREAFEEIFDELGLRTDAEKAELLGIAESNFSRARRRKIRPGADFIASALWNLEHDERLQGRPATEFSKLFPIEKVPVPA